MIDRQFINEKCVAHYGKTTTRQVIVNTLEKLADKVSKNDSDDLELWIALTEIYIQQLMIMNKIKPKDIYDEIGYQLVRMNHDVNTDLDVWRD